MKTFFYLEKVLNRCGFEICRMNTDKSNQDMSRLLSHVSNLGFSPQTVIDVGVANGTFELYKAFPNAFHFLIEPLAEFESALRSILKRYRGAYIIAAAGSRSGQVELNVHQDHLEGSSLLKEEMGAEADGIPRTIQAIRIDDLLRDRRLKGPFLIKVDVQGAELDVLEGALEALGETEMVILEVSMFQFMKDAPQFYDVVSYMKNRGFVGYDIFEKASRPLDGALGQINMAFVKEHGRFRNNHSFATAEQWKDITGKWGN
ncbi:MAG: FkbM family methyltransferase [bacterium]